MLNRASQHGRPRAPDFRPHPISAARVPGLGCSTGPQSSASRKEFSPVLEWGHCHGSTALAYPPLPELTRATFPLLPDLRLVCIRPLPGSPDPGPASRPTPRGSGIPRVGLTWALPAAAESASPTPLELPWFARPRPGVLEAPAPGLTCVLYRPWSGPNLGGAGSVLSKGSSENGFE